MATEHEREDPRIKCRFCGHMSEVAEENAIHMIVHHDQPEGDGVVTDDVNVEGN